MSHMYAHHGLNILQDTLQSMTVAQLILIRSEVSVRQI